MWLVGCVDEEFRAQKYTLLLEYLYNSEYNWYSDLDGNWASHGVNLRERFLDDSPAGRRYVDLYGEMHEPCSVLEMLVALSIHAEENVMANDYYGDRTGIWFWTMLANLGLLMYDDNNFFKAAIDEKLNNFMMKKYNKDGTCGPFLLSDSSKFVVKNMSFWQQAMNYMSMIAEENGEI